jgi:sec-independent protein translocase protein TatB
VFGLSFGELVMLLLVAVVVLGPKEMPRYLRKAGQLAGQLRRMAYDMRTKSGIDEVLRSDGIGADIAEIRRLATFARGELGSIMTDLRSTANGVGFRDVPASPYAPTQTATSVAATAVGAAAVGAAATSAAGASSPLRAPAPIPMVAATVLQIDRAREYPTAGADSYGALPEGAKVYEGELPSRIDASRETSPDGASPESESASPSSTEASQ